MNSRYRIRKIMIAVFIVSGMCQPVLFAREPIRIGSKHFTESYLLAEIMGELLTSRGYPVDMIHGLGGTMICFKALTNGSIDVYPDYTGTIEKEILKQPAGGQRKLTIENLRRDVNKHFHLTVLEPFGFNNTYAVAVTKKQSEKYRLNRISDLTRLPDLKGGVSYEFLEREDGWKTLQTYYGLQNRAVGLEHGLAYAALREGKIDFTDAYTTDAKIAKLNLRLLTDDKHFFPSYLAVPFVRSDLPEEAKSILRELAGRINGKTMVRLNAEVEYGGLTFSEAAHAFLVNEKLISPRAGGGAGRLFFRNLARRTGEHLFLTLTALFAAILIAVPVGVVSYRLPAVGRLLIPLTGLLQTIPSIALLAFMIPVFGIGKLPAVAALFLYSLLPIVRNTYIGLKEIEPVYLEAATAMGMRPVERMRHVELPLAYPTMLAGIKTAAIINIGTATLAAFIGAGGLGEPIVTGLALNNNAMILEGAVPAAALAIFTELLFRYFDRPASS